MTHHSEFRQLIVCLIVLCCTSLVLHYYLSLNSVPVRMRTQYQIIYMCSDLVLINNHFTKYYEDVVATIFAKLKTRLRFYVILPAAF